MSTDDLIDFLEAYVRDRYEHFQTEEDIRSMVDDRLDSVLSYYFSKEA